jgi:hypothetical protein
MNKNAAILTGDVWLSQRSGQHPQQQIQVVQVVEQPVAVAHEVVVHQPFVHTIPSGHNNVRVVQEQSVTSSIDGHRPSHQSTYQIVDVRQPAVAASPVVVASLTPQIHSVSDYLPSFSFLNPFAANKKIQEVISVPSRPTPEVTLTEDVVVGHKVAHIDRKPCGCPLKVNPTPCKCPAVTTCGCNF